MKKILDNLAYIIIGVLLAMAGTVYAVNITVPQATIKGDLPSGLATGNYQLLHPGSDGQCLTASSTSVSGLAFGSCGTGTLPASGIPGQFLGNTATNTPAWLRPGYTTVCSSGCDYTATGTNDNIGINAAISAVNTAGGGTVLIKAGNYHLTGSNGQINLRDKSNINLIGEGDGTKIFIGGGLGIEVATSTNIQIEKLYIDGSGQSHATFNGDQAIQINNSHNIKVNNNTIQNSWGFGMFIINNGLPTVVNSSTSDVTIMNNYLNCMGQQDCIGGGKSNTGDGSLNTADVNIIGNTIIQNSFAGGVINSNMDTNCIDMVAVYRVNFESNNCKGGVIFGNEKYPNTYSKISNNIIDSPLGPTLVSGEIAMEEGCNDCTISGAATGTPAGNLIIGNILKNGGIYISGHGTNPYNHLLIEGNTIQVATSTAQHFRIAEHGLQINNVVNSTITGNNITAFSSGQATDGIFMQSSTNNLISNNFIRDFATGIDMASANQEQMNIFSNVTTRVTNPGGYIDSNGSNIQIGNNASFIMSSASSTAMVAQILGQEDSSNQIFILPNAGDAAHPASAIYFGYNSPMAWTFGGSCCGGSIPTQYNFNSSGTNTWNVAGSNVLQITSTGITLPLQSASQLLGTDGSKKVISYAIPLIVANGGTGTSTLPTIQGQILSDDGTHKYAPTNLVAGSNITITTTTPGQITIASTGGGSGNSAWTIGSGLIYNATSTDSVYIGTSTVSSNVSNLDVFGTGTKMALRVSSSSGQSLLEIENTGNIGIGTSSATTTLFVQGKAGTNPFAIASSTGTQLVTVTQAGNVGIGTTTPAARLSVEGSADQVQLIVKANATQTTNMQEWQNSTGGVEASLALAAGLTTLNIDTLASPVSVWRIGQVQSGIGLPSTFGITWGSSSSYTSPDIGLFRGGVNTLYVGNGTSASATGTLIAGNIGIGTSTPTKLLEVFGGQAGGVARITRNVDVTNTIATNQLYGTYDVTAYSATTTANWPDLTGPCQTFSIATGTLRSIIGDICSRRNGINTTGDLLLRSYNAGNPASNIILSGNTASSSVVIMGTPGSPTILTVASSSGTSLLTVTATTTGTTLLVVGSRTNDILAVASSSNTSVFTITSAGDIKTGGTTPTLSSCGTSPSVVGTDTAMEVTVGSVAATACTITFATVKTNAPVCTVTNQSMSVVNAMTYTISTTSTIVSQTGLTGDKLDIICVQK